MKFNSTISIRKTLHTDNDFHHASKVHDYKIHNIKNYKTSLQVMGHSFLQQENIFSTELYLEILKESFLSFPFLSFHGFLLLSMHIPFWWTICIQPNDTDQIMEKKNTLSYSFMTELTTYLLPLINLVW